MLPAVFELEPGHRNQRKMHEVWEGADLGRSRCLRSGRGGTGCRKTQPSPCTHALCLAPRPVQGRSQVSGEQAAWAGALPGTPKTRQAPDPHQPCFSTSPSWHAGQAPGHGEAPTIVGACAMCYSTPIIPGLQEVPGQREMLSCWSTLGLFCWAGVQNAVHGMAALQPASHAGIKLSCGRQPPPCPSTARFVSEAAAVTGCKAQG